MQVPITNLAWYSNYYHGTLSIYTKENKKVQTKNARVQLNSNYIYDIKVKIR